MFFAQFSRLIDRSSNIPPLCPYFSIRPMDGVGSPFYKRHGFEVLLHVLVVGMWMGRILCFYDRK